MAANMKFNFLDVGMGDGTLVVMGNTPATSELALIDLGVQPFTKFKIGALGALEYLRLAIDEISFARGKKVPYLDHLFITHPDQDHYNRLLPLIEEVAYPHYGVEELSIGKLTYGGRKGSYPGKLINKIGKRVEDQSFDDLANCQHSVVNPDGSVTPTWTFVNDQISVYLLNVNYPTAGGIPNPVSLCLMFEDAHGHKMIFMGDAEEDVEAKIIKNFKKAPGFLNAYGLKLGHHGSLAGTSEDWLQAVKPTAVFATGDFVWAHPYCPTLKRVLDAKTLEDIELHRFCCGVSDKEYFNHHTPAAICINLWYVVKSPGGELMVKEKDSSTSLAQEGLTYGVQWEMGFAGKGGGRFFRTFTSNPK